MAGPSCVPCTPLHPYTPLCHYASHYAIMLPMSSLFLLHPLHAPCTLYPLVPPCALFAFVPMFSSCDGLHPLFPLYPAPVLSLFCLHPLCPLCSHVPLCPCTFCAPLHPLHPHAHLCTAVHPCALIVPVPSLSLYPLHYTSLLSPVHSYGTSIPLVPPCTPLSVAICSPL